MCARFGHGERRGRRREGMAQVFHRSTNTISKASIFGFVFLLGGAAWGLQTLNRSDYITQANVPLTQPVPFSHKHHVGGMGIDCRYCHTSVEESAFAKIPPTKTCMNCHSQIWNTAPILEPVRASLRDDTPLHWTRVHDLPDFVYFNHSIQVKKGMGCATCHGPVDKMPLMYQHATLQMSWCLDCHRNPARYIRPREQVFNMSWRPPSDDPDMGARLVKQYKIASV